MGNFKKSKTAEIAVLLKLWKGVQQLEVNVASTLVTSREWLARAQEGIVAETMACMENAVQTRFHDFFTSAEIW